MEVQKARRGPIYCELCGKEINIRTAIINKELCNKCKLKVKGLKKCGWCERWRPKFSCEVFGWSCRECFKKYGNWDDEIPKKKWAERKRDAIKWKSHIPKPYSENDLIQRNWRQIKEMEFVKRFGGE